MLHFFVQTYRAFHRSTIAYLLPSHSGLFLCISRFSVLVIVQHLDFSAMFNLKKKLTSLIPGEVRFAIWEKSASLMLGSERCTARCVDGGMVRT
jgi:hypothetical protein